MEKTKKKIRWKKILIIALIVIAALGLIELAAIGLLGHMGPFSFLYDMKFNLAAGNAGTYGFDRIEPAADSPLQGKNICVLGSSVTYGMASGQDAVAEYLGARLGCTFTKEAVSGTTLADTGKDSYVQRMYRLDPNAHYDLFICQLSTNDAGKVPLGDITDGTPDASTTTGAMETIIRYVSDTWHCPVVFFTNARYDSEAYAEMIKRLYELREKYGIGIIDLWSDDGFNAIPDTQRKLYMYDRIHPTKAGYRDWWGPELERQLKVYLSTDN